MMGGWGGWEVSGWEGGVFEGGVDGKKTRK